MPRITLFVVLIALVGLVSATPVETEISGVRGELLSNVRANLSLVQAERLDEVSVWRLRQMADDAREEVRKALRPFGYYRPRVDVRLIEPEVDTRPWRAVIDIEPGSPVTINQTDIRIVGEGAEDPELVRWRRDWPLTEGAVLKHPTWEQAWRSLDRLAERRGYFDGEFRQRRVEVHPDRGRADVRIVFETGPRYRFGRFEAPETGFSKRLLERLNIIGEGDPYHVQRIDEQRQALVRSGLFERVVIDEHRDESDHRVDLSYRLERRTPNTYRATIGFGTDTGARLQLGWVRHYLSSRGNRLDSGFGAQQRDNEFVVRSEYQHPRGSHPSDFLTAGAVLRREQDNFRFVDENRREAVFESFEGRREQTELTLGRLQDRRILADHFQPLEERIFVSLLHESFDAFREARFSVENERLLEANPELEPLLRRSTNTLALGTRWRLPNIRGSGFGIHGQVLEARLLGAHESLGSPVNFSQAYLSGRWHHLFGDRHKLMVRGELGYTEARTQEIDVTLDERELELSITELPERYRFKTGGDRTVRGYGFENLSTNRNGANHLLVGSVEYEYRVGENWSLAAFYDIGNAFNQFDRPKLKRGTGVGFRWYTLIGPVQIDIAQALDDPDRPWRLHFTIGTQLL